MTINFASPEFLGIATFAILLLTVIVATESGRKLFNGKKKEVKPPEWKGRLPTKRVTASQRSTFRVTSNYTPRQKIAIAVSLAVIAVLIVLFLKGG